MYLYIIVCIKDVFLLVASFSIFVARNTLLQGIFGCLKAILLEVYRIQIDNVFDVRLYVSMALNAAYRVLLFDG